MFAAAIAIHLDGLGIINFDPDGPGGDCFISRAHPSGPDSAVFIEPRGALPQPTRDAHDRPVVWITTRGPRHDPLASVARQDQIYSELACLDGVLLAEGTPHETWLIGLTPQATALGNPQDLGQDANERPEHLSIWTAHTRAATTHRPATTTTGA